MEDIGRKRPPVDHSLDHSQARTAAHYEIAEKTLLDPESPSAAYITALAHNTLAPDPITGKLSPPVLGRYTDIIAKLAQPLSRGSIHIASKDISKGPIIDPKYLTNTIDRDIFAEHMLYFHTLAASKPLTDLFKQPLKVSPPSANFTDLDAAKEYIESRAISMLHPAGTCAMLPESKGGVIDIKFIVPLLPPGNLQSTVYAVAERPTDLIKSEHGMDQRNQMAESMST
ncbi:GMC oxidoreductase-domain-containing protein [Annulohypoxylon bovei var. microspora]|nr:GMC oxidoreductase-domain-containing protein [Annulohypoxylon bovei var. microspora]